MEDRAEQERDQSQGPAARGQPSTPNEDAWHAPRLHRFPEEKSHFQFSLKGRSGRNELTASFQPPGNRLSSPPISRHSR